MTIWGWAFLIGGVWLALLFIAVGIVIWTDPLRERRHQ